MRRREGRDKKRAKGREKEAKPKTVVVGVHNQTDTLGRRLVPSKNCVMEGGRAGECPAGKGEKLTHPTMCQAPH